MEYPRVLVIAHNPFSDSQNNGKTLSAFFDGWPKDKLAQIYLTPDKPDYTVCENFFRITDLEVLKSLLKKDKSRGNIIEKGCTLENEKEELHKNGLYILIKNLFVKRLPLMYCVRNFVWEIVKPWKTSNLQNWISNFNPDVVFFQSSNMYSIFDMVNDICDQFNVELLMETTDDYVTKHFSLDPFYLFDINKMIKKYEKLVKKSKCVFAIGDMMAEEYERRFGGNFKVAMNSVDISNNVVPYTEVKNKKTIMTYAGNLGLNRWKVLYKIGKTLKELEKDGVKAKLNIYSIDKPNKKILKKLNLANVMSYNGSLDKKELIDVRNNSDILVHVESFDKKNKYITRLSVSTKIPEYLASKRCILAVGPEEVASIKYIADNKIGTVIDCLQENNMKKIIMEIITNRKKREIFIKNADKILKEKHSFEMTRSLIHREITNSI